jgi:cell division control protein 6
MLHPLTATEFRDILSNLETMGLVGEVQERGRGRAAGGPMGFLTPSRLGRGAGGSPLKNGGRETGLVCFVGEKELETHITGPGEGVLKALLREEL